MCGIVAQVNSRNEFPRHLLNHRGPDQEFLFKINNFSLEYFRLSVTGGDEGKAPVYSENLRWVVFLNGEIYNYKSLISSHRLPFTHSDTQVIANGLSSHGIKFLKSLRGMFAGIAINLDSNMLYVFRDALGEKPLFYSLEAGMLSMASEFKSLLKLLGRPIDLNYEAVESYFRFSYNEEPTTFDKRITPFPKGSVIQFELDSLRQERLFDLIGFDENEISSPLEDLLESILDEQLDVEVPAGLALSGGVDSNALLVASHKRSRHKLVPIVVDLPSHKHLSEALTAISSCKNLGLNPTVLNLNFDDLELKLLDLVRINDQPHADPSSLAYAQIFKYAHEIGLKVVFLGHGPDEFFWGYPWLNSQLINGISREKSIADVFRKVTPRPFWDTPAKNSRFMRGARFGNSVNLQFGSTDFYLNSEDLWERTRAYVTHSYLVDNGLRQSDRLSMAYSIESRTPFADARLYGWSQKNSRKLSSESFDKKEFRKVVDLGTNDLIRNKSKQGFSSPYGNWFEQENVKELLVLAQKEVEGSGFPGLNRINIRFLNVQEKYRILILGLWLREINLNH
jgi:asparagine synthase (glutamine-hydrolysing)